MDDGVESSTAEMVRSEFPHVRYFQLGRGLGPAFQRNRGIQLASCNIAFPIDDDSLFVSSRTIEQTLAEFDHPRVAAVGIPYVNVRQDQIVRQCAPHESDIFVTSAFVGASHAIRRDIFLKVGGFREHFFYMGEEGDLCLRMLNAGYLTRLGNADPIHHLESPRRDFGRMDFYGRRNDILFAWHNVPTEHLLVHLLATTFNGVRSGFQVRRPLQMLRGTANGWSLCVRRWNYRQPVPANIYRLNRRLKKRGPQVLSEIERFLPAIPQN